MRPLKIGGVILSGKHAEIWSLLAAFSDCLPEVRQGFLQQRFMVRGSPIYFWLFYIT